MMNARLWAAVPLLLLSPLAGQVSSPTGYLSTEGDGHCLAFGLYPEARYMFVDAGFVGSALTIKEVAWRHNAQAYRAEDGLGRSWSSVTLDYAPCDATTRHNVFSQVALAPPTRVFSGSMAWPTILGSPPQSPAAWGGPRGGMKLPFTSAVLASGRNALSFDITMRGGQLNGATWTNPALYYVDSYLASTQNSKPILRVGLPGCGDTLYAPYAASAGGFTATYGRDYQNPTGPGAVDLRLNTSLTAPGAPVVHVVGFAGSAAGIPFPGLGCARLHLDLSQPTLFLPAMAGRSGLADSSLAPVPFQPGFAGLKIWFQAAWNDSQTQRLNLTHAVQLEIAPEPRLIRRGMFFSPDPAAAQGFGFQTLAELNPLFRYGQ